MLLNWKRLLLSRLYQTFTMKRKDSKMVLTSISPRKMSHVQFQALKLKWFGRSFFFKLLTAQNSESVCTGASPNRKLSRTLWLLECSKILSDLRPTQRVWVLAQGIIAPTICSFIYIFEVILVFFLPASLLLSSTTSVVPLWHYPFLRAKLTFPIDRDIWNKNCCFDLLPPTQAPVICFRA